VKILHGHATVKDESLKHATGIIYWEGFNDVDA